MRKSRKSHICSFILFSTVFLILATGVPALAHRVVIFAWVEGDTVFTESKFGSGKKAVNAQVMVFDGEDEQLLEGKTDDKGEFSFKIPKFTDLRIVLDAGMGHKGEWRISESEIRQALADVGGEKGDDSSHPTASIGLSKEEIKTLIDDSLDRKLRPIMRILAESKSQTHSVTEIVGGIGYIFGLMGVALYCKSRGKKKG